MGNKNKETKKNQKKNQASILNPQSLILLILGWLGWRRVRANLSKLVVRRLAILKRVNDERTPAAENLPFEEIWFKGRDGLKLHGWFIPAKDGKAGKATIIMGHGHGASKVSDLHYARFFHGGGYSVFMFDFRGHGQSDGPRGTSMGYWERFDVTGATDWLLGRGLHRIGMFGISMGAAIAVLAAAENNHIKAVVLDSPYAHLRRSIAAELTHMWGVPMWVARLLGWYGYRLLAEHQGFPPREGNPASVVAKIAPRPIFIIHGEQDRLTQVENAFILFKVARHPKELWIQPGIGHAEGYATYGPEYERRVLEFFDRVKWEAETSPVPPDYTLDNKLIPHILK